MTSLPLWYALFLCAPSFSFSLMDELYHVMLLLHTGGVPGHVQHTAVVLQLFPQSARNQGAAEILNVCSREKSVKLQHPPRHQIKMVSPHFAKKNINKQLRFWEQSCRKVRGGINSSLAGVTAVSTWALRVTLAQAMIVLVGFSPQHLRSPALVTEAISEHCSIIPRHIEVLNQTQVDPGIPIRNNSRKLDQKQNGRRSFLRHWLGAIQGTGLQIIVCTGQLGESLGAQNLVAMGLLGQEGVGGNHR